MKRKLVNLISVLLLIVVLLMATGLSSSAKVITPMAVNVTPGETVTVKFQYEKIMGFQGRIVFSSPSAISKYTVTGDTLQTMPGSDGTIAGFGLAVVDQYTITLVLTVSETAKIGETVTVSLKGYGTVDGANDPPEDQWGIESVSLTIVEKLETATLRDLISQAEALNPSAYTSNTWKTLQSALTNAKSALNNATTQRDINAAADALRDAIKGLEELPKPPTIDYSSLLKQIKIAEGLVEQDYTAASWKNMKTALTAARAAKSSTNQSAVDSAANALKDAINALVPVSGSKVVNFDELNKQIAAAEALKESDYTAASWSALVTALANAKEARSYTSQSRVNAAMEDLKSAIASLEKLNLQRLLDAIAALKGYADQDELAQLIAQINGLLAKAEEALHSGDQAIIDSCAVELENLLRSILSKLEDLKQTNTVIVEKPVPTDPTDDFCNIGSHIVWIVLFWISFASNVAVAAFIISYYFMKKKKTSDDTPLVDYDITDDVE